MRETLKIMSMNTNSYMMSYFLTQMVMVILGAMAVAWGFKIGGMDHELVLRVFSCILMFGLALISLSMTLSTFFRDSKLAPQVGMTILMLPTSVFFYVLTNSITKLDSQLV